MSHRCGAPTRSGGTCQNLVAGPGGRCHLHRAVPVEGEQALVEEPVAAPESGAGAGRARTRSGGRRAGGPRSPSGTRRPGAGRAGARRRAAGAEELAEETLDAALTATDGTAPARDAGVDPDGAGASDDDLATDPSGIGTSADDGGDVEDGEEEVDDEADDDEAGDDEGGEPDHEDGEEVPRDPRLDRAAARCAEAIERGALDDVDALAVPYLGEAGWERLREAWTVENCATIATGARQALRSPGRLHDLAGQIAGQVWSWLGRPWVEQMMVRELVKRLPIVGESQVRPLVRAAQVAGMRLCLGIDDDLTACPCFADLVEHEGERQPRRLFDAAAKGLPGLSRLR